MDTCRQQPSLGTRAAHRWVWASAAEVNPAQKVVTGNGTIDFTAVVTIASGAAEGTYTAQVIARAETPGSAAAVSQNITAIRLVRNRLGVEAERTDIENLITRQLGATAQRSWRTPEEEHNWALKLQTEEQSLTAGPVDSLMALSLNYSWTLREVDDLLRPRRGYLHNLQLGGASEALLSTRSFSRGYGRGLYILPIGRADRSHLRGELGAVWANEREGIPSEFLFRAGGDQSVRGYDYESLGVKEGTSVVGGRFLGVATVEYQHDFTAQWGGAMFIDAGNAADSPSELRPVYGYGVGVRWITPAGSLNLDIAQPKDSGKVRLHFTLGVRF